jgi:hypothetical protein
MGHGPHSSTLFVIWVFRLLFVLFCVLFVCKCVLPLGDNPIAVNKYIIIIIFNHKTMFRPYMLINQSPLSLFLYFYICTVQVKIAHYLLTPVFRIIQPINTPLWRMDHKNQTMPAKSYKFCVCVCVSQRESAVFLQ